MDLLVKKCCFETDLLRVSGEIQNETEFTAIGQAQTISFQVGDKNKLKKSTLLDFEKKMFKKACESKSSMSLLVLLDKDEMIASEFSSFSF